MIGCRSCGQLYGGDPKTPNVCFEIITSYLQVTESQIPHRKRVRENIFWNSEWKVYMCVLQNPEKHTTVPVNFSGVTDRRPCVWSLSLQASWRQSVITCNSNADFINNPTCSITSGAIQHGVPTKVFLTLCLVTSPPVARNALTPKSAVGIIHVINWKSWICYRSILFLNWLMLNLAEK